MKKIVIVLLITIGLAVCNSEAGNYTDEGRKTLAQVLECQRKALNQLIGKTFTAYPDSYYAPFDNVIYTGFEKTWAPFGVKSPEKFTVLSIQKQSGNTGNFYLKIKFDSGRIAYCNISSGNFLGSLTPEKVLPELKKIVDSIHDSCGIGLD